MNSIRLLRLTVGLAASLCVAGAALAQTATATFTSQTPVYSASGGTATFDVSIQYPGVTLASLGLRVQLPAGWSYASASGTNTPSIPPESGTTEAAEFAYITAPANSAVFSFVLNYPAGLSGDQTLEATLYYKPTGAPSQTSSALPGVVVAPRLSAVQSVASKTLSAGAAATLFTPIAAQNGASPYAYAISPALPSGLSLNTSSGAISGTPAAASGPTTYTVTITDSTNATASNTFSLTVNAGLVADTAVPNTALTTSRAATTFRPVTPAGGTEPYTYALTGTLPSGLSFNTSNGAISGTPTVTLAATTYTVTITDDAGATASNTFSVTVNAAPSATSSVSSHQITATTAVAPFTPVTVAGGTTPISYTISPALPATLVLNASTGTISGTAAAAAEPVTYTVTGTDVHGAAASQSFVLTVNPMLSAAQTIATKALTATVAATGFRPVTATGGTSPYVYAISPALPSGLTFNTADGSIAGPAAAATAARIHTITIHDSAGAVASNTFSLTVNAGLESTVAAATKGLTINTAAVPFTPIAITGGTGPYAYTVEPALPVGLSLNATTGTITGTPTTVTSAASYTVTVTDSVGATTSESFTLTVNGALSATQSVASRTFTAGTAAVTFQPVTASGGTSPRNYAVSPALPAGLTLSATTGEVSGTPSAAAVLATYTVTITDEAGATASNTFTLAVNGPVVASQASATKSITAGTATAVFTPVTAAGGTAPYVFAVAPALPSGLTLNPDTGAISGTAAAAQSATTFTVTITDAANATASSTFSLTVNAPVVATQAIATKALTAGTPAAAFTPVTASAGTAGYTYSIEPVLPASLQLNTTTGAITGTATNASSATSYTITVTDSVGSSATASFTLTVNVALAASGTPIATRTLTAGAAATAFAPLELSGGTPGYGWSIAPTLPSGLTLDASSGAISGTPAAGLTTSNFTVTGSDSVGAQVAHTFALTVNPALTATQAIATRTLSADTAASSFTPVTASGGTPSYTYAISPALPTGLALNATTGAISGTPAAALGATTYTVTINDAVGASAAQTFTLTINGPLTATQNMASKALTATTPAVAFIPVAGGGGTAPYRYSIDPALPPGLELNDSTGAISGTTAVALPTTIFTVTVDDSAAASAENTFSLTVNPPLATTQAIANRALTAGTAAMPFIPITAEDGTPPYTFTVAPSLPAGLELASDGGEISGTAAAAAPVATYTITATDSVGAASSKTFSLTVNVTPTAVAGQTVATKALTAGTAAVAFSPLPVSGGTPPFTYSVTPALPEGLALEATTGAITGTATAAAEVGVYTITATDSVGATVTQELTLVVNPAPVVATAVATKTLLVNEPAVVFTPVTVSSGGTTPFVFTVSPDLPAGLSIASSTGAISGTPTSVSPNNEYTVTATDAVGAHASATFALKINSKPTITTQPAVVAAYRFGDPLALSVAAAALPVPTYQWRHGGEPIPGATAATLDIAALALADAGIYDVVVTNESGAVTSNPVTVNLIPRITTQPQPQTILAGESTAAFQVVAEGYPAQLSYQWCRGGAPLPGKTTNELILTSVPLNGSGDITVIVTNAAGSATSNAARLTVNPTAPEFAAGLPSTATAIQGRSFSFPVRINNTVASFSAAGLPVGLTINASTGTLSGIPTALGASAVTITASNVTGTDTHALTITVQAPPPVITSAAATKGRSGNAYTADSPLYQAVATNGATFTSTELPAGLVLDAATGKITGTPTVAGTFTIELTATNATGAVTQPVVLTIDPPPNAPVYTGTLTPAGTQGVSFSFTPVFNLFGTGIPPYVLTGALPAGLTFAEATGAISGTPTETGSFTITIAATNAGGTTTVDLTLVINPAPTAPVITSSSTAPAARVGVEFTFNLASAGVPNASSYSATGLPAGLSLDAATGAITGTPTVFGSFNVTVSATNSVGKGPESVLAISVAPSATAPVLTSAPIARGRVGQLFPTYTLTGSNAPTAFAVTNGVLPAGLTLNATSGEITGTPLPAALGETRVWFKGMNGDGNSVSGLSLEVVFVIRPALAAPVVTSNGTAAAQVGQPFQYAITAFSGMPVTRYGATGLPAWLTLDVATGVLSGIPTSATLTPISIILTATYTVDGTDVTSSPKTLLLTVAAAPATPVITSPLMANGRVGASFEYAITASEAPTSYVASGLPAGLTLDADTGVISGTPTAANTFDVVLRAANAGGLGAPATLKLKIAPAIAAPSITSAATAAGQVGVAFSYQIVATNGPIVSYRVTGTLPLGLTLNTATGVISGRPAEDPRTYTVQLTATNAGGTSLPQPLVITIAPALGVPVLTTARTAFGQVGEDFTFTITATNLDGAPPYAPPILLDAVNLPPGLAVNPATGVIEGTPTTVGTTTATLTATNAAGTGQTRDLEITILPAPTAPVIGDPGSAAAQVGEPFNYQIVAANSPTSYEVLDAPAWMTVNGATGTITGVPTAPGAISVDLVASNAAGSSSEVPLSVIVAPAANTPVVTSSRTQRGTVGTPMSFIIEVAPALPVATFVATGLPSGLTLNPTTGEISGTPNESGRFEVVITPSNANGVGAPITIVITIQPNVVFGS